MIPFRRKPVIFAPRVCGGFQIDDGFTSSIEYTIDTPTVQVDGNFAPPPGITESPGRGYGALDHPVRILVQEEGEITFSWRVEGGRWSEPIVWSLRFTDDVKELEADAAERITSRYWADLAESGGRPMAQRQASKKKRKPPTV
jgi:hypothetical protein